MPLPSPENCPNTVLSTPLARKSAALPVSPPAALSLRELDDRLASDAHYAATPTRNYGLNDPVVDAPKFICSCPCGSEDCGLVLGYPSDEQLQRQGGGVVKDLKRRNYVVCKRCGRRGRASAFAWSAVIDWNQENYGSSTPYESFPFFNLSGLDLPSAQERVKAIRADLELRKAQAKRQSHEGIETGRKFKERIEAYLRWAIAAASLLKVHARTRQLVLESAAAASKAVEAPV